MPLVDSRKAIRFPSKSALQEAILKDWPYQYRHLALYHLMQKEGPWTRKELSELSGIPINAISHVARTLVEAGLAEDVGRIECPFTGRLSNGLQFKDGPGPF